jgi:hypothetical protein
MIDFVTYCDTDSIFVDLGEFIKEQGLIDKFNTFSKEKKIEYIIKISKVLENYINNKSYEIIQKQHFNSQESEFRINFKQELVAEAANFVAKKKYALWVVNEKGAPCDKLEAKGLDIIQSSTPEGIKDYLKEVTKKIIHGESDDDISEFIHKCKDNIKKLSPEEIAVNLQVNNMEEYIFNGQLHKKVNKSGGESGIPITVKGSYFFNNIALKFDKNIELNYEPIKSGDKVKVVYLKNNKWKYNIIAFPTRYPKELNNFLQIDYETQIEKYFIKKIELILEPAGKLHILKQDRNNISDFFDL